MSLLEALERIERHEVHPFIAPILEDKTHRMLVFQDGLPIWFTTHTEPGWVCFEPRGNRAHPVRLASPHEYLEYLDNLPRIYVVSCFRFAPRTWAVIPYNPSDAMQRGWMNCEPRLLHLVRDSITPTDVLDARALGDNLLYGTVNMRGLRPEGAVGRAAQQIIMSHVEELARRTAEEERQERLSTLDGQVQDNVEFMGAQVVKWAEVGENIRVTWDWRGHTMTSTVQRDMSVETVGFCTAGTDRLHNLTSAVALLQEGVRRRHYAVER
jgi:hypothetical protein